MTTGPGYTAREIETELALLELEQASVAFVAADDARRAAWLRLLDAIQGASSATNRLMGRTS